MWEERGDELLAVDGTVGVGSLCECIVVVFWFFFFKQKTAYEIHR